MSGSSEPLGQSSRSPFGSPSVLGQTNNGSANPLTPKPFGCTIPFSAQTGGSSVFGGTSIGGFVATQSSSSTATFGASSSLAFGTSVPAFGCTTPFSAQTGGSSVFGGTSIGGFVATQSSSSTATFGASSSPAFGTSVPAFGSPSLSSQSLGQAPRSPLGSPSVLRRTTTGTTNPLTPKPFGSTTLFRAQTGGSSTFGGTSIGGFGPTQSSSTATFGASSSPAFGTSVPAFGSPSSSSRAFGAQSSSCPIRSESVFGQTICVSTSTSEFGGNQSSSPLSSTTTFGTSSSFDSGSSLPSFRASLAPAFGSLPASFGGSSIFGQKPGFGDSGSTQTFGSSGSVTGVSRPPVFESLSAHGASNLHSGSSGKTSFGTSSTQAFGVPFSFGSTPTFGSSGSATGVSRPPVFESLSAHGASNLHSESSGKTPFGTSSTQAFGVPFSFGSTPTFGSSGSATGVSRPPVFESFSAYVASNPVAGPSTRTPFGTSSTQAFGVPFTFVDTPAFGTRSFPFGAQVTKPLTFGSTSLGESAFGVQIGGSGVAMHTPPTSRVDSGSGTKPVGRLLLR